MVGWNPTQILWTVRTLETSTGATLVETDAGKAYAKLLGNEEGPHVLACEVVATRAATWLGLPTASFAVVEVEQPTLIQYKNGTSSQAGPAFCSQLHKGNSWGGTVEELSLVENQEAVTGLVVLDTWLRNCDRYSPPRINIRNVFFSEEDAKKGKVRLLALDHTHCFTCGRDLTPKIAHIGQIQDRRVYGLFPEFEPYLSAANRRRYLDRLNQLTRSEVQLWTADLPDAWEVDKPTRTALEEFLLQRAGFLVSRFEECLAELGNLDGELRFEDMS